jgi:hypothetical protein
MRHFYPLAATPSSAEVIPAGSPFAKKTSRAMKEILWPVGARHFGFLARLSEGAWPQCPVTERKRSQKPKEPLPVRANRPATEFVELL